MNHPAIKIVTTYIQNNLANKITMAHLRDAANYSERSIQLMFEKHLNQTPFEYIEEQRLNKAKYLIEQHKQSKRIADIALDLGMTHLGCFSVNFKRRFGLSPSALAKA
jgi:transcriptional regulator GlxA family with amidase domain